MLPLVGALVAAELAEVRAAGEDLPGEQRLAAVEVPETPAELRDSLQFQTASQSGLQKTNLVELELRTYLKL